MSNDFTFNYEKVSVEEAGALLRGETGNKEAVEHRAPSAPHEMKLLPSTSAWIQALPLEFRPLALAKKYPRIANELSQLWNFRAKFKAKIFSYMIDDRGGRQGFPPDVLLDLTNLKTHYDNIGAKGGLHEESKSSVPAAQRGDLKEQGLDKD